VTKLEKRLARNGSYLLLTHGEGYSDDTGAYVPRKQAESLTGTLWQKAEVNAPMQRRGMRPMTGQEDGLFPGFSQTWRYEA